MNRVLRLPAYLLVAAVLTPPALSAQAGGAGGGAGSGGAGSGSGGAGSGGAGGAQGGGTAGHGGSSTTGTTGAASQSAPGTQGTRGAQAPNAATPNGQQSNTASYAAAASPGSDPRKPPASRPGALTLQQVVDLARNNNPTLLAAEQNLRAVRAQELQAGVRANPYIGVAASNVTLPANGRDGNPYVYAVQVSRLFERGNKREYRLETARALSSQTEAQLHDTERQTILAVKQAFTRMLIAKQALELSTAQLKDFQHEVDINHERFVAGDIGKLDFERLDLQLGSFESDRSNAEITYLQASDQLQTLIGKDTPDPNFDIIGPIVPPPVTQTIAELLQTALARRPDLLATTAGVTAAEANARLTIANGTTDPTLEGEYDRSGTFNSAGFNFNFPIRIFDRNQGNKDTARYQAQSARLSQLATRNQVASDIDQAWIGYTRARALSDRFGNHYLDVSADVLSIARFAYDHGGIALIDYLDALRDARSATSDALNAYAATWNAIHQLSAASATEVAP